MLSNEGASVIALRADGMERDAQTDAAAAARLTAASDGEPCISNDAPDSVGGALSGPPALRAPRIFCRSGVEVSCHCLLV